MSDHDRPLNDRGKRDAPRVGQFLRAKNLIPDRTLCSTAKRARKTAQKALEAAGCADSLVLVDELYLAHPKQYVDRLQALPPEVERVMVVGHNPGLEELVEGFTSQPTELPTAALVQLEFEIEAWGELQLDTPAKCVLVWTPKSDDGTA